MKKIFLFLLLILLFFNVFSQNKSSELLYYHSNKGLTFIPPLTRPGLVYNGKLYIGKNKLSILFSQLNDEKLNAFFKKYKANKTAADILSYTGNFALPLANLIITAQNGKVNWWLLGATLALNTTSNILNLQAQKNLLEATIYYDKTQGLTRTFIPQQQTIGIAIPLTH